jgi:hypothetical protein
MLRGKAPGGTSLCLASLLSIGYQRFVELNWSFMRRLVRAYVKALKKRADYTKRSKTGEDGRVQPCHLSTPQ